MASSPTSEHVADVKGEGGRESWGVKGIPADEKEMPLPAAVGDTGQRKVRRALDRCHQVHLDQEVPRVSPLPPVLCELAHQASAVGSSPSGPLAGQLLLLSFLGTWLPLLSLGGLTTSFSFQITLKVVRQLDDTQEHEEVIVGGPLEKDTSVLETDPDFITKLDKVLRGCGPDGHSSKRAQSARSPVPLPAGSAPRLPLSPFSSETVSLQLNTVHFPFFSLLSAHLSV